MQNEVAVGASETGADSHRPPLKRWIDRVGAAVVAPRAAMAASDTPEGQGRASGDIALLLVLALLAVETRLFVTAGWMIVDGDWAGSFTVVMVGIRERLAMPMVLLLAGSVLLTVVAGRARSLSADFDLACVALIPLVVVELANALLQQLGLDLRDLGIYLGYSWSAALMVVAYMQTRQRKRGPS